MTTPHHAMHCMEIWGGSESAENAVSTPGLDAWIFSRPFEGARSGGDVHYVSLCGGGIITRLILADVSGHGDAVADLARSLRALMRGNINRKSQAKLVDALNRQFAALSQEGRFATAVVATYLDTRKRLSVCNAGHPRPLFRRRSDRQWMFLDPETADAVGIDADRAVNLPLGLDDATPYAQFSVRLGDGDIVVVYTDALIEAADPSDRQLGEDGLLSLASLIDSDDPEAIGRALLNAVSLHRSGREAEDDVTLLCLAHRAGPRKRLSVAEKIDVYAKVFGIKDV